MAAMVQPILVSGIYAKLLWTAVQNLCIDPTVPAARGLSDYYKRSQPPRFEFSIQVILNRSVPH